MNTDSIITALLAAATALKDPATAVASDALKDLYGAMKYYLRRKVQPWPDATQGVRFRHRETGVHAAQSCADRGAGRRGAGP